MSYETHTINNIDLKLDPYLRKRLDNVKKILKKNWDCVFIIDGMERSGKSTLGLSCAWYISDGKFKPKNIVLNCDDAIDKIEHMPNGSILMLDESSLIFSSKDHMRKEQKKLIKILNVVGQKNMVFIIILPSIFELVQSIAVRRSRFLLHVYTDERLNRGRFTYFGEKKKKILYTHGKKNYGSYKYPKSDFKGTFLNFNPFGDEYLKIKDDTLLQALKDGNDLIVRPDLIKKDVCLKVLKGLNDFVEAGRLNKLKPVEIAKIFGVNRSTIYEYNHILAKTSVVGRQINK